MPHIDVNAPEQMFREFVQRGFYELEARIKALETELKAGTSGTLYACTNSGKYNSTTSKQITIKNGKITQIG